MNESGGRSQYLIVRLRGASAPHFVYLIQNLHQPAQALQPLALQA